MNGPLLDKYIGQQERKGWEQLITPEGKTVRVTAARPGLPSLDRLGPALQQSSRFEKYTC